jgi:hypothetical protein
MNKIAGRKADANADYHDSLMDREKAYDETDALVKAIEEVEKKSARATEDLETKFNKTAEEILNGPTTTSALEKSPPDVSTYDKFKADPRVGKAWKGAREKVRDLWDARDAEALSRQPTERLKTVAEMKGLPTSGTKPVLAKRIADYNELRVTTRGGDKAVLAEKSVAELKTMAKSLGASMFGNKQRIIETLSQKLADDGGRSKAVMGMFQAEKDRQRKASGQEDGPRLYADPKTTPTPLLRKIIERQQERISELWGQGKGADTERDAVAALGYVHARDRMFQMELMRRAAISAGGLVVRLPVAWSYENKARTRSGLISRALGMGTPRVTGNRFVRDSLTCHTRLFHRRTASSRVRPMHSIGLSTGLPPSLHQCNTDTENTPVVELRSRISTSCPPQNGHGLIWSVMIAPSRILHAP